MSNLVSYYEEEPVKLKRKVEIRQQPMPQVPTPVTEGTLRAGVVYVLQSSPVGPPLHIPFASFDEWSLRDRYNEALRIVNTLGASKIECETFGEVKRSWRGGLGLPGRGSVRVRSQRVQNSGFDYAHTGTGSQARDPRPLRWPDEPGFAAAVVSVLENRATRVAINIHSSHKHSVSGELGTALRKLGFELGVGTDKGKVSTLHIEAEFPARRWGL